MNKTIYSIQIVFFLKYIFFYLFSCHSRVNMLQVLKPNKFQEMQKVKVVLVEKNHQNKLPVLSSDAAIEYWRHPHSVSFKIYNTIGIISTR